MRFTLTVSMDNAAFGEDGAERADELARILHEIAARFGSDTPAVAGAEGTARDYNGNTVARWEVVES